MGIAEVNAPEPGTLVAGKYRVDRVLASGGMGVIVEAEHATLGQRVAIKFLRAEAEQQSELAERFLREGRAAARLQSDHVVRVFDIGTDDRGMPYMVMELLSGRDLGDEIDARGPLPVAEAVGYVVEALDAICEAHAAGIVHRDLKPSNLFLAAKPDGSRRVKVLDFGISKLSPNAAAPDAALTSTTSMLGSPGYMSPEQVRSTKSVDVRTDVWALGVILYEMLTGAPAFLGETLGDIFAKIREEDLPPIQGRRPEVPDALAATLHDCLRRDRETRIADAATLRHRLLPYAASSEGRAPASQITVALEGGAPSQPAERRTAIAGAETVAAPAISQPSPEPARVGGETLATWAGDCAGRRRGPLLIGTATLLAVGLVAWFLFGRAPQMTGGEVERGQASAPPVTTTVPQPPALGEAARPIVVPGEATGATPLPTATTSAAVTGHPPAEAHKLPAQGSSAKLPPHVTPAPTSQPSTVPTTAPSTTKKKEDLGI